MGHVESGHVVWMRSAIVAVALGVTVAAVAAACWLPQLHRHVAHPNHPLTTSVGSEFVINTDHGHLVDNSMPPCPERLATAVLPRSATPVLLPDVVAAAPGMTAALTDPVARAAGGAGIRSHRSRPVDPVLPGSSLRGQRQAVVAIRHRR
ncbi:lipoprotein lpqS [Mycobacterium tuberculosis]|nr:lipoprotein lpqS [Mycobacterium tuberculosis]